MSHHVFIVEDHADMREAYRFLLEATPDLKVCGVASTAEEALAQLAQNPPDLVIIDLSLPKMSGLELIRHLHTRYPNLPLLVISGHDGERYVERAFKAGARGYIDKKDVAGSIREAVRQVIGGRRWIPPQAHNA